MKSNYKYKIGGDSFILSPEEHEKIKSGVMAGKSQFWLREGELMINMSLAWHVSPTNEPTEAQQAERDNQLRLEPPKWREPTTEDIERRDKIMRGWKIKYF